MPRGKQIGKANGLPRFRSESWLWTRGKLRDQRLPDHTFVRSSTGRASDFGSEGSLFDPRRAIHNREGGQSLVKIAVRAWSFLPDLMLTNGENSNTSPSSS